MVLLSWLKISFNDSINARSEDKLETECKTKFEYSSCDMFKNQTMDRFIFLKSELMITIPIL